MLDFRIRTFLTVCKYMNFTRAAEALHITQPAVSQHIRYLEKQYGAALFTHRGKGVQLTHAGEILLSAVTTLQNDEQTMLRKMHQSIEGKGKQTFGVTLTIGEFVIAAPVARYLENHPDTDIHIRYGNTTHLLEALNQGEIDFALVEGYFKGEDYETMILKTEEYIPVCMAGHTFAQGNSPKVVKDLISERLLTRERGSGTREILERALATRDLAIDSFAHIVEVESMHTIVRLLVEDCGIAFLYKAAVRRELEAGVLRQIPLEDFYLTHDFTFLWDKNSVFSEEYRQVCTELKEAFHRGTP